MMLVTIDVTHNGTVERIGIQQHGPTSSFEADDAGGERWYTVTRAPRSVHNLWVRHYRRDGALVLARKALDALVDAS